MLIILSPQNQGSGNIDIPDQSLKHIQTCLTCIVARKPAGLPDLAHDLDPNEAHPGSHAMADIMNGNLQRVVPVQGSGEMRLLAQTFNQMSAQLLTAREQLQRWNQILERTVAERTDQLEQIAAEAKAAREV